MPSREGMKLKMTSNASRRIFVAIAALALASTAQAAAITIFNTGVNGSGASLSDGTIGDLHYTLVSVPGGSTSVTRLRTSAGGYPVPPWIGDDAIFKTSAERIWRLLQYAAVRG